MAGFFSSGKTKNILSSAKNIADSIIENVNSEDLKKIGSTVIKAGADAAGKLAETGAAVGKKAGAVLSSTGEKAKDFSEDLKNQKEEIKSKGYSEKAYATMQHTLVSLTIIPMVRVDREDFLRKTFGNSQYIDQIIAYGPQAVYTPESLRKKADDIIATSTRKTSLASFAAGLPSNVFTMFATVPADIVQFFAFSLNLAQKIAYLFGEDDMFSDYNPADDIVKKDGTSVPEKAQFRMISYLGTMLGVSGAGSLLVQTSKSAGISIGKKVASQALTKTAWYPIVKKVGSVLGYKITKKTVENALTKTVPLIGGVISGSITYATFKPMGCRLADVFVKLIKGEFDTELELNETFKSTLGSTDDELDKDIIEGNYSEIEEYDPMDLNHDGVVDEKDMVLLQSRLGCSLEEFKG